MRVAYLMILVALAAGPPGSEVQAQSRGIARPANASRPATTAVPRPPVAPKPAATAKPSLPPAARQAAPKSSAVPSAKVQPRTASAKHGNSRLNNRPQSLYAVTRSEVRNPAKTEIYKFGVSGAKPGSNAASTRQVPRTNAKKLTDPRRVFLERSDKQVAKLNRNAKASENGKYRFSSRPLKNVDPAKRGTTPARTRVLANEQKAVDAFWKKYGHPPKGNQMPKPTALHSNQKGR